MKLKYLLLLFIAFSQTALCDVLDSGLVGYWCFDNIKGGIVSDNSGHGHNGQIYGSVISVPGPVGNAVRFNGSMKDYIRIPSFPDITGSITISAWAKPRNLAFTGSEPNTNPLITKGFSDNKEEYTLWMDYNKMNLLLNINNNRIDCFHNLPFKLSDDNWYHFVSVYDFEKKQVRLYFNGSLMGSCPYDKPIVPHGEDLFFAASFPGGKEYFRGDMDEVRIYDRALDDNEVMAIFLAGNLGILSPSQFYIDFGSVFPGSDTTVSVIIKNSSKVNFSILPVRMMDGRVFSVSSAKTRINAGDNDTVPVKFTGNVPGRYYDTLLIESNINCDPLLFKIPVTIELKDYFRLRVWFEDTSAISGTNNFGLVMKSILRNYDTTFTNLQISGEVQFPADAFMPENIQGFTFKDYGVSNGKRRISFSGITTARHDTSVVLTMKGTVLMPDSAYNAIEITKFDFDNPLLKSEPYTGKLHVIACAFNLQHINAFNRADINLYPNPSGGELYADYNNLPGKSLSFTVYDSRGFVLSNETITLKESSGSFNINTTALSSGIYNVSFSIYGDIINRQFVIVK